jgi:hypothetical protein
MPYYVPELIFCMLNILDAVFVETKTAFKYLYNTELIAVCKY